LGNDLEIWKEKEGIVWEFSGVSARDTLA